MQAKQMALHRRIKRKQAYIATLERRLEGKMHSAQRGMHPGLEFAIETIRATIVVQRAMLEGMYAQFPELAEITGNEKVAE